MSDVVAAVRKAGVVGAGGGGFPTHAKLSSPADIVIVNGAECEPLLNKDVELMARRASLLVSGLRAALQATSARRGIIALKAQYRQAIAALEREMGPDLELFKLDDYYPAGDEHEIVHEVTGRIVPEAGIPTEVGVVVNNVETLINVANALNGRPVTDKVLSVAGAVRKPQTIQVPIGTTIHDIINAAGGASTPDYRIIVGGPMMGFIAPSTKHPVDKTTNGLIVLPTEHQLLARKSLDLNTVIRLAKSACTQCTQCTELCNRFLLGHDLEPHMNMRSVSTHRDDLEALKSAWLCSECGLCELYACPLLLSPRLLHQRAKELLAKEGIRWERRNRSYRLHSARGFRRTPPRRLVGRLGLRGYDLLTPLSEEALEPQRVHIPLRQHAGAPARATVRSGDRVSRGDLVGQIPEGELGASVHASLSGEVVMVDTHVVIERR